MDCSWVYLLCLFHTGKAYIDWSAIKPIICVNDNNTEETPRKRTVYISIMITDLYGISENDMEMGVQVRLREVWFEPSIPVDTLQLSRPQRIPSHVSSCIWLPDTIFQNMKSGGLYDITSINRDLKVVPGGYFYRFSRYFLTLSCPMTFHSYPMDSQKCQIIISLMASSDTEVDLRWFGTEDAPSFFKDSWKGVQMSSGIKTLQFQVTCANSTVVKIPLATGNYTNLQANFVLCRHLTASLVNIYIPSFLLVCVSWVSFWLDPEAVPGRVTLGVTSILTLSTQIVYARNALPPLDYMTAIDVWLFSCLLIVVFSLLEFTVANYNARNCKIKPKKSQHVCCQCRFIAWKHTDLPKSTSSTDSVRQQTPNSRLEVTDVKNDDSDNQDLKSPTNDETIKNLVLVLKDLVDHLRSSPIPRKQQDSPFDRYSKILFPGITCLFAVGYWVYYQALDECKT